MRKASDGLSVVVNVALKKSMCGEVSKAGVPEVVGVCIGKCQQSVALSVINLTQNGNMPLNTPLFIGAGRV